MRSPSKPLATPSPVVWKSCPPLVPNHPRSNARTPRFREEKGRTRHSDTCFSPQLQSGRAPGLPGSPSPQLCLLPASRPFGLTYPAPHRDGKDGRGRAAARRLTGGLRGPAALGTFPPGRAGPGGQRTAPRRFRLPHGRQLGERGGGRRHRRWWSWWSRSRSRSPFPRRRFPVWASEAVSGLPRHKVPRNTERGDPGWRRVTTRFGGRGKKKIKYIY